MLPTFVKKSLCAACAQPIKACLHSCCQALVLMDGVNEPEVTYAICRQAFVGFTFACVESTYACLVVFK